MNGISLYVAVVVMVLIVGTITADMGSRILEFVNFELTELQSPSRR